jgi:biotin operon repressor
VSDGGDRGGQLRRMILLLTVLGSAEAPMSAEEIAAALECESRTARRDLEVLRECGVEVTTVTEGRRVAYSARPLLLVEHAPCECGCGAPVRRPYAEIRVAPRQSDHGQPLRYASPACRRRAWVAKQPAKQPATTAPPGVCRACSVAIPARSGRGRPPVRCDACRPASRRPLRNDAAPS